MFVFLGKMRFLELLTRCTWQLPCLALLPVIRGVDQVVFTGEQAEILFEEPSVDSSANVANSIKIYMDDVLMSLTDKRNGAFSSKYCS